MSVPLRNLNGEAGEALTHLHAYTLADYTVAGTTAAVARDGDTPGDLVTVSSTGNWYVKRPGDGVTKRLGEVVKVEVAASGSAVGYLVVEWIDADRVKEVASDDATTVTLGNSLITDGDTSVSHNFDAGSTTGPIVCVSKSAASGAIKAYGLVFGS